MYPLINTVWNMHINELTMSLKINSAVLKVKRTIINDTHYESFTLSINQVNGRRSSVLITKLLSILGTLFIVIYNRGVFGDSCSS